MTHTPGPWKVEDDENGDTFVRIPGHDIFITNIEGGCGECYANARLIAAAPDLLEACEAINTWCGTDDAAHALPFTPPWYDQLYSAVVKARGEA